MIISERTEQFLGLMEILTHTEDYKTLMDAMMGELFVLRYISRHDSVIPGALCKLQHISTARMTAILNSLEKKGLISREIDAQDRRRILIHVSPQGQILSQDKETALVSGITDMFAYLGEEDTQAVLRIIERLVHYERSLESNHQT